MKKRKNNFDFIHIHHKFNLWLAIIVAILLVININFIGNNNIRIIGLTLDFYIIIDSFIFLLIRKHNLKVEKGGKDDIHR